MASLARRKALYGIAFLLPSVILLAMLFIRPFIDLVVYSLYDKNLLRGKVAPEFVGLGNYIWAFTSPEFRLAMLRSVIVTTSVGGGQQIMEAITVKRLTTDQVMAQIKKAMETAKKEIK